jgi:hypothetical protein
MDFDAWTVDLKTLSATHSCGFRLEIEGSAKDPSAVHPGKFPGGISGIDQARLVRTGVEAIAKAPSQSSARSAVAKKPAYKAPANKPKRPVLSLKKKQPEDA